VRAEFAERKAISFGSGSDYARAKFDSKYRQADQNGAEAAPSGNVALPPRYY